MKISETARKLVDYCNSGQSTEAYRHLFAEDAEAWEPEGVPERHVKGLANLIEKSEQFEQQVEEWHRLTCSEPLISDDYFCCEMTLDVTFKGMDRSVSSEIAVYRVNGEGKISEERFFYSPDTPAS